MRVRTMSFRLAPAFTSAASIFLIVCTVCACASPTPTILPSGPVAVVPDTEIVLPIRTAREYPTIGSHGAPLDMFSLAISNTPFDTERIDYRCGIGQAVECHPLCAKKMSTPMAVEEQPELPNHTNRISTLLPRSDRANHLKIDVGEIVGQTPMDGFFFQILGIEYRSVDVIFFEDIFQTLINRCPFFIRTAGDIIVAFTQRHLG